MIKKFSRLIPALMLIPALSCSFDGAADRGAGQEFTPFTSGDVWDYAPDAAALKGWELNNTNTGLVVDKSTLSEFDLEGADKGCGEWLGEKYILYLYGNKTIENRTITCSGYIKAPEGGTIIRNCIIRPTGCSEGMSMLNVSGAVVENCEIDGSLLGTDNIAHAGISASNSTIRNCLIHDCDCGIMAGNTGSLMLVENNYIFNVKFQPGSDDHLAGCSIWSASGKGIIIINNRVEITDPSAVGVTSAAFFSQSLQGPICNVRIEGNLLVSPAWVSRITSGGHGTYMPYAFINNRFTLVPSVSSWGYYAGDSSITIIPEWTSNFVYNAAAGDGKGDAITLD